MNQAISVSSKAHKLAQNLVKGIAHMKESDRVIVKAYNYRDDGEQYISIQSTTDSFTMAFIGVINRVLAENNQHAFTVRAIDGHVVIKVMVE